MEKRVTAIRSYLEDWSKFEILWLICFTLINIYLFIAWQDSIIGLIASLTGMLCVVLTAKGKISNYYPGIINVILYAYISFQYKYYGEVMLNVLYFLPMQFYGLYIWKNNRLEDKNKDSVQVTVLSTRYRVIWMCISCISIIVYGYILKGIGGNLPFYDATSTVLSVIAMILMARRYMEQWVAWIIVDIVSVAMWVYAMIQGGNDITILVMWTAYLVNACYGCYNWIKLYKSQGGV